MLDCPITPSDALPDLMSIGHLLPPRLQAPNLVFYSPLPYSLALYHTMAASSHLTNALPYRGPCIGSKNSPAGSYQWVPTSIQCGGAIAWRRKEERWVGSACRGMVRRWGRFSSRVRHRGVLDRERVPERCHASGAAVDVCSDTPAWAQRAERAADGGVVDVARARSVSPRAP
jgi:hypothetical protein